MQSRQFSLTLKRSLCGLAALFFLGFMPAPYAFADSADGSAPAENASCSPVAPAPTGIKAPTGSDAITYTYNGCTGLWENQYYTWNPATQQATPKTPLVYTCDTATWRWRTKVWIYDPSAKTFVQVPIEKSSLPTGAIISSDSTVPCVAPPATPAPAATTNGSAPTSVSGTNTTNATIQNGLTQTSQSGNASVTGNNTGGSATSGNSLAMANVINSLQSSSSLAGDNVATFVANINGDVQGDLIIDPSKLQPAVTSDTLNGANIQVNNQTNGQIQNDITLAADSGAATVADNTSAGNATSGNADAIANVVNMINSVVSSGKSFVGVINVNGNLSGNILMPQNFLDSLIASNAPTSTLTLTKSQADTLGISNTSNLSTTNNIKNTAASGVATVADNTSAGSATSGDARTKVTVFNLTGSQVVGANCLLVFVNVSGTWVGVIMNAPAGATAAALGSGLTNNSISNATVANTTSQSITNNIDVSAMSGAATVADNTNAGNATTGNANTAVNLLNMNGSNFTLAGWFGILFINIFGNWYGNFGVYTQPPAPTSTGSETQHTTTQPTAPSAPKVFQFIPTTYEATTDTPLTEVSAHLADQTAKVLGTGVAAANKNVTAPQEASHTMQVVGAVLVLAGLTTLTVERYISKRSTPSRNV